MLTGDGPCYWNAQTVAAAPLRRVRNVYIDKDFAELLLRQALMNKAKSYATHAALAAILPGQTCSLLPRHARHWWPLLEDIFMSPKITQIGQDLTAELLDHKEFEVLSIDATMRCCLSNLGQARPRAAKVERDAAVFRGDGALTCVLTVRGRSSAVLLMEALSSDGSEACVRALADHLPARGLAQTSYVLVDNPSQKYWKELCTICPSLQVLALDPVHLAMACEYASARKRTASSRQLRLILRKLTAHDAEAMAGRWGPVYHGGSPPALATAHTGCAPPGQSCASLDWREKGLAESNAGQREMSRWKP